ncbi:bifunctional DNA primase/polymerase (plasmid) [Streptomyces sp. HUAS TT11]|uniref:bifunctional DNA primase/polymerase n=1 Tax=Streptomyces sp. HUAS TT11 TaxID=3447508 RepID=UPI003F65E50D
MPRSGETRSPSAPAGLPHAVAHWCAAQGWPVHPLAAGRKTPAANCASCKGQAHRAQDCPCLSAGRPCHGFHAATLNRARIDAWWTAEPSAGVGIACGPADLVVIDVDAHPAPVPDRNRLLPGIPIHESVNLAGLASGFDTLALLAALRREPDPAHDEATLRVRTPSGGLHIWYRNARPEERLRCSTGSSPKVALAWQVDVRAHGGYIVAPGTRTKDGTYRAEGPVRLPAPLPDWLREELARTGHVIAPKRPAPPAPARRQRQGRPQTAARVLAPLLQHVAQCAAAPEGTAFTEKLNRAAYTAGGLVAAGHLDQEAAREHLLLAAHTARPWQSTRNERVIDDALRAGAARPFRLEGLS